MRNLLLLCLLLAFGACAQAQKISYAVPSEFRSRITAADYKLLLDSTVATVGKRYPVERISAGTLTFFIKQDTVAALPLDVLTIKCLAETNRQKWGAIIRQHVASSFRAFNFGSFAPPKLDPHDYESVRAYLSLRVYPEATVAQRGGARNYVTRVDVPGTVTMLMLDLPSAFSPVPRAAYELWQQPEAVVFGQALANVAKQPVKKVSKDFDGPNNFKLTLHFLSSEDYAASYALDLAANAPEFVGEWGCALALPNRGLVSACPISRAHPLDFVQYIQFSQAVVAEEYQEHPQPISPDFYWYYQGKFTRITVVTDKNGQVNVIAPPGLTALMTAK